MGMSGLIPQPFIDNLLTSCDLVALIDNYVPLKKTGNSYVACCPFHQEKTPSFHVISKKQFYYCFGCGMSGNAISFIMNHLNQNFVEAVHTLASRLSIPVPTENKYSAYQEKTSGLYAILSKVSEYYQKNLKYDAPEAVQYLIQRGIDGKIAKAYQLGYAPDGWHTLEKQFPKYKNELVASGMLIKKEGSHQVYDRYRNRIMFPIHDRQGHMIGFGGRALQAEQKPKYLNSPETPIFQKNRELYGLYQLLLHHKNPNYILVVEGYMDVIALAQHGITQAVAVLGTAFSHFHMQVLHKYTQKVILCFDGDTAGKEAARRAMETLLSHASLGIKAHFIFLPEKHDPDSLIRTEGQAAFLQRLSSAISLSQVFFYYLSLQLDVASITGKTQLIERAKPYFQKMPDSAFKQLLLEELAKLTHLESDRLEKMVHDHKAIISNTPIFKEKKIKRTPLRLAIAILLQRPDIYEACQDKIKPFACVGHREGILPHLLDILSKSNGKRLTTAHLVECFRDHPQFAAVNRLAIWDYQVPEDSLQKEFLDIICFLQKQNLEKTIKELIFKSRQHGLTEEEKYYLQDLLKKRTHIE